ncbi:hypothetical protein ABZ593_05445 [Streptomyces sp. NPDC012617]|uniref:hypothetical protein n=1 Tax=Streptomyces TaxID=1883 RepID=UPI00340158C5
MSYYTATFFVDTKTHVRSSAIAHPTFYVEPAGNGGYITFQMDSKLSADERLDLADKFASAAVAWRDQIAAQADEQRTATDELAAARAEIARLKAAAEGTAS